MKRKMFVIVACIVIGLVSIVGSAMADGMGPAPNSGDCISDGSGFETPNGQVSGPGSALNSGDGVPDGPGWE